ncbi:MAG: response regulator [Candidatus Wolfebacteria bacterium]|nr:response regulator [Candidatus Wolfebacteria bacterium]
MAGKPKKILLIEDEPFLSSLLKNRLQKENFEVLVAKDGEEAIKFLKSSTPNLILLDIILPKKSGFEIMEDIKSDPELSDKIDIPVIIISNLSQPEDIQKSKQLGAIEYFVKAKTSIDDLVSKVKTFVK